MFDQFTVTQKRGSDSTITVSQKIESAWPKDEKILSFYSDQSLLSNSNRAGNVMQSIDRYCLERGYQIRMKNRHNVEAVYSPQTHSQHGFYEVMQALKEDPRYKSMLKQALAGRDEINLQYGAVVQQLANLIHALKKKNQAALDELNQQLIDMQITIVNELDIPDFVKGLDRKYLLHPQYPPNSMNVDSYNRHGQGFDKLPPNLDDILALLD